MKIIYCTGNKFKLELAKKILTPLNIEVEGKKMDLPEIQENSIEEVAKFSSQYASNILGLATLKNDSGLVIPALKGFPGPYTKYVEETLTEQGIIDLMQNIQDRRAYFLEVLAYTEYGKEPVVFVSKTEGTIAKKAEGEYGFSYDRIFIPKGYDKPMDCYDDDTRWKFWSNEGYTEFANYIKKHNLTEVKNNDTVRE